MTDHEERERLAKIAESMRDSCPDRPEETIGDYTIVPLAYSQRADFAAIARLLREPVNAEAMLLRACKAALAWYALDGDGISDPTRQVIADAIAATESAPREGQAAGTTTVEERDEVWVRAYAKLEAEVERLRERVESVETDNRIAAQNLADEQAISARLAAELARLRAAPRVGVEDAHRSKGYIAFTLAFTEKWGFPGRWSQDVKDVYFAACHGIDAMICECWPAAGKE